MVALVAILKVKPGKEALVSEAMKEMAAAVRSEEKGCLMYEPYTVVDNPGVVYVLEKYEAMSDLEKHREMPHYHAYKGKVEGCFSAPLEVVFLEPIG